ncbi:hypothetical protein BW723_00280 [Polaribacter reichenbachii]|uniref:Lipid/polyisoprenoid-binding YceI-like domain-containing protein n=1 Tax=Polaribacter reichenbachii TaxID=996801 RepID=A0A1B8U2G7_9FLAO|nr:YceI family protein [Polaribacter reichenbachii]APZ44818.1 hypothetical protein BW723_00280 [Polaribacter reichenbachii]AUC18682.1 hypothetical protein BTO17_08285 [Polaribacter reichenbachii]OBY66011.1 hypothetical protein LPB301_07500 [Polaribacter reichenbachii]
MRKIIFLIGILSSLSFVRVNEFNKNTIIQIKPESKLEILGTTNINKFECNFNFLEIDKPVPLFFQKKGKKIYFKKATLVLKNSCFDCGSRGINRDFSKLLKSNEFPLILLDLKEIEKKEATTEALVEMTIAGISKTYKIPVKVTENKNYLVTGNLDLNIEDYNLKVPKKMLGLIVVSEMIKINFNLILKKC